MNYQYDDLSPEGRSKAVWEALEYFKEKERNPVVITHENVYLIVCEGQKRNGLGNSIGHYIEVVNFTDLNDLAVKFANITKNCLDKMSSDYNADAKVTIVQKLN